jgi:hypothetical protein
MELIRKNFVLIGIIAVVILGGIWYSLAGSGSSSETLTTEGGVLAAQEGDPAGDADPDVLKLLLDMRSIKLDGRLFNSPAFRILQDTGKDIIKEPTGRRNPFSPIGTDEIAGFEDASSQNQQGSAPRSGNEEEFAE